MANPKIKFKRSAVEGKRPDINSLELGELALNTYDGRLFLKRDTSGAAGIETGNKLVNPWIENNANTGIACTYQVSVSGLTTFTENVHLLDSDKLIFGTDEDLEIYHDGSHSYISDQGQGNLKVLSNNIRFTSPDESKVSATFVSSGDVDLYYNNDLRFSTTGVGVTVWGETETRTLNVSGVSTFGSNIISSGTITATQFVGDGSGLSNIPGIGTDGSINTVGVITASSFVGDGSAFFAGSVTTNGMVTIEDNLLRIGDTSNNNYSSFQHATSDGYGFDWEFGQASVIINEQGTTNQALVLGDVSATSGKSGLFGISHTSNSGSTWTKKLDLQGNGELFIGSTGTSKVWHAGNDGSGSGLDADTLDGIDSGSFLRSDAADTATGLITLTNGLHVTSGDVGIGTDNPTSKLEVSGGDLYVNSLDGSEVDIKLGIHATHSNFGVIKNVRVSDSQNYLSFNVHNGSLYEALQIHFNQGLSLFGNGDYSTTAYTGNVSRINFADQAVPFADIVVESESASSRLGSIIFRTKGTEIGFFPRERMKINSSGVVTIGGNTAWHAGNDGSGSGLDADLLDGIQSVDIAKYNDYAAYDTVLEDSGFISYYNLSTGARPTTGSAYWSGIQSVLYNDKKYGWQLVGNSQNNHTEDLYVRKINNNTYGSWSRIWTAASDGAGSGLDADTVDGVQASSFLRSDANDSATGTYSFSPGAFSSNVTYGGRSLQTALDINSTSMRGGVLVRNANDYRSETDSASFMHYDAYTTTATSYAFRASRGATLSDTFWVKSDGTGYFSGTVSIGGNTAWHAGNDGSGSGLDADLLDGINSGSFLRSDANDTLSGLITLNNTSGSPKLDFTGIPAANSYNFIIRGKNDAGNRATHFINGSTRSADGGPNTYTVRNDGGSLRLGSSSYSTLLEGSGDLTYNANKVWHEGNIQIHPPALQGYPDYEALIDFGSASANTWKRIVNASLQNTTYNTIGFKIEVTDPSANHGTPTSVDQVKTETYYVACVRTESTTPNNPDACYVRGPGDRIRATKTATGVYQIHIKNSTQWREYRVKVSVYAVSGVHTINYYAGDTASAGTAQYNASVSSTSKDVFQNIEVKGSFTGTLTNSGELHSFADAVSVANLEKIRFGRSNSQFMSFYGDSGGNKMVSVSSFSNPKANIGFGYSIDSGSTLANSYTLSGSSGTIWHTGNDGSGSGLDADLLDGQHGSYYQNATNLTSGTIPDARITDIGDSQARIITLDNLEKSNLTADGQLSFDSSQGLLVYRAQQGTSGATTTVLDGWNIAAGTGISITNLGAGDTALGQFTFSLANHSAALLTSGTIDDARIPDTITPTTLVVTQEIRGNGTQLVLNAGEAAGKFASQTAEKIYLNAEGGVRVSTPSGGSNFESGYATNYTEITGRGIYFRFGTTRVGEITSSDTSWLRINQETAKNIYTPRLIRADGGFFVDGSTKGINGSGNFIGGTIAGASDYGTLLRSNANDTLSAIITGHASDTEVLRVRSSTYSSNYLYIGGWSSANSNDISRIRTSSNLHIDSPADGHLYLNWYASNRTIKLGNTGQVVQAAGSNTVWHGGNDGSGSGLDADLLDGIQGASFLRSDADDTMTGALTIDVDNKVNGALRINANQTNTNNDFYFAQEIFSTLSGTTAATGDREQGGLFMDINSTNTGGDTSNEHRAYGIYIDLDSTGDSDVVIGVHANVTATPTTGTHTDVVGAYFYAEDNGGAGSVTNVIGVRGFAVSDNSNSDANGLFGGYFKAYNVSDTGNIGGATAVYGEIEIPNGTGDHYGNSYVFRAEYDDNDGVAQTNTTYLYYGNYSGTLPTTAYGIYIESEVPNYLPGSLTCSTIYPKHFYSSIGSVLNPWLYGYFADMEIGSDTVRMGTFGVEVGGQSQLANITLDSSGDAYFDGRVTIYSGFITLKGNKLGAIKVSIADNAVATITPPRAGGGYVTVVEGGDEQYPNANCRGFLYADWNSSPVATGVNLGTLFEVSTAGPPNGTTGSDGHATLFSGGTAGKLYLENRLGSTGIFFINFI